MNRSSRLISRMMLAFFIAVFGPILLLSWRDWHELLQIGKKTSVQTFLFITSISQIIKGGSDEDIWTIWFLITVMVIVILNIVITTAKIQTC